MRIFLQGSLNDMMQFHLGTESLESVGVHCLRLAVESRSKMEAGRIGPFGLLMDAKLGGFDDEPDSGRSFLQMPHGVLAMESLRNPFCRDMNTTFLSRGENLKLVLLPYCVPMDSLDFLFLGGWITEPRYLSWSSRYKGLGLHPR